ncbi:MAG: hypothetical protein R3211_10770, partial [Balneolaceae bacterium]|nr:hypothetical protein [Balneolaceae bacterium]
PLWFVEGLAEYLSTGDKSSHTAMWLRDAVLHENMPSIRDLSRSRQYFPYRYGHAVWAYITGRWGDDVVDDLYVNAAKAGLGKGIKQTLGIAPDSLSTLWVQSIRDQYSEDLKGRTAPDSTGLKVLSPETGTGRMNVAPSISPDGERVAFISQKNLFSLELFLADAKTGRIIRKLTSTATDPHLNSIRFIDSSGSWSPEGEKFAASVFYKGDNAIVIIDANKGGIERRIRFDEVDALTNPAWSPDGSKIAFSGSDGGYNDLYLYDLETKQLTNLTGDRYTDIQPVWSPDGSRLAFVTDRGPGTDLDNLIFGNTAIGVMNIETREIELLPEFYNAKHINPQFSSDGNSLFYISDYNGFSDVYRYDFENGRRYKVTHTKTGISGISELSPAITVSRETGDMMVTVFKKSNYNVHRISADQTTGEQVLGSVQATSSAKLPPMGRGGNQMLSDFLSTPILDLPADTSFSMRDYGAKLRLETITGGGGIGISTQFGGAAVGGVTFRFSDMLRQHILTTTVQLQGRLKDFTGQVSYLNRDHRFVWGGSVSHVPFRTSAAAVSRQDTTVDFDGDQVTADGSVSLITQRIFQERVSALGMYPLSSTQRFEISGNWTHIWYDIDQERTFFTDRGIPFKREDIDPAAPSPINLFSTSAAFVSDNSLSAFTGPIRGHRLRLEVEPTVGTLDYTTALADYRRYIYMQPFTLALRALHLGRYGDDSDDTRLSPNYVGFESLVRGYNINSFDTEECAQSPGEGCAVLNRLFGSRIAVANVEFRVPVLGIEDLALFRTRTLPTTLNLFFDGGYAWNKNDPFDFGDLKWTTDETEERIPVFSTGAGLRFNVFGALIAEVYFAVPFQRPNQGGYVGFHIAPGF